VFKLFDIRTAQYTVHFDHQQGEHQEQILMHVMTCQYAMHSPKTAVHAVHCQDIAKIDTKSDDISQNGVN
jgi:hypothetical protein